MNNILIYTSIVVLVLVFIWFTRTKTREFRFIQKNDEKWYIKRKFVYLWCLPMYHYERGITVYGSGVEINKVRYYNYEDAEQYCKNQLNYENWTPVVKDVTF